METLYSIASAVFFLSAYCSSGSPVGNVFALLGLLFLTLEFIEVLSNTRGHR